VERLFQPIRSVGGGILLRSSFGNAARWRFGELKTTAACSARIRECVVRALARWRWVAARMLPKPMSARCLASANFCRTPN